MEHSASAPYAASVVGSWTLPGAEVKEAELHTEAELEFRV